MNRLILCSCILLTNYLFAQNITVEYAVQVNRNNSITSTEIPYVLAIRSTESFYFNTLTGLGQFKNVNLGDEAELVKSAHRTMVKLDDSVYADLIEDFFYKNYLHDSLIFNELLLNKKVTLTEPINLMSWEVIAQADSVILGFKCQKAVCNFRGRQYEAYFSSELFPYGGPWKFDGLPGLILAVRSIDDYFIISPLKIIKNDSRQHTTNPYLQTKEILTWKEFTTDFEKRLKQILKMMKAQSEMGEEGSISKPDRIEDLGIKAMSF